MHTQPPLPASEHAHDEALSNYIARKLASLRDTVDHDDLVQLVRDLDFDERTLRALHRGA